MNKIDLKQMYGTTPDSFKRRVAFALRETARPQYTVRRLKLRTALIAAMVLVLVAVGAYAVFSSRVAETFGQHYGQETKEWLEKGEVDTEKHSFTIDEVIFTLEEVVYRSNGLYGVGTITVQEGSNTVLIPEDYEPDLPYGYDAYAESAPVPEGTPTVKDAAMEKGGRMLVVRALPNRIGVDGGVLLDPGSVGSSHEYKRDGSLAFMFELSDAYAVTKGESYEIEMWSSIVEMNADGSTKETTGHGENWNVHIKPAPMQEEKAPEQKTAESISIEGDVELIVSAEYEKTGTAPIYRLTERNFGKTLKPEEFNRSGIAKHVDGKHGDGYIVFKDEAVLSWGAEALFYQENSGTYDVNAGTEYEANYVAKPALSDEITSLASWAKFGWPGTGEVLGLEKTALSAITLEAAKETLEAFLEKLGVTGYKYESALDMSVERIATLGSDMNAYVADGYMGPNAKARPVTDYNAVTALDEGFYLSYVKPHIGSGNRSANYFYVNAYVTPRGIVNLSVTDYYIQGDIYDTPETLVAPETVLAKLPNEMAASRFPLKLDSIISVRLTYAPMRAANPKDGMVLSPIWLINYKDEDAAAQDDICWAEFDAITGDILNAIFK